MKASELYIAVMSYGMGPLLENCLRSLERNAQGFAIAIYDDGSKDAHTRRVLEDARKKYSVHVAAVDDGIKDRKTGGLYHNMNSAVDDAVRNGFKYIMFIQDDMQLMRPIDDGVLREYGGIFANLEEVVQIRIHFMKDPWVNASHVSSVWVPSDSAACYVSKRRSDLGIMDTGIIRLDYVREKGFRFVNGELSNVAIAAAHGWTSVFPLNPIVAFLPWPPTITERLPLGKWLLQQVTDRLYGVGYHPLKAMTPEDIERLVTRPPESMPYAEDFLELADGRELTRPWWYERSIYYLIKKVRGRLRRSGRVSEPKSAM